jgi:predicted nicotinamide N-methyase
VRSGTSWAAVPFVPEIRLLTAAEPFGLWDLSERDAPPFWAFPWAGGQALARYLIDHPETVRGRRVLDVASGSGLVAIAAAKAGAASVTAGDVDPNAVAAIAINASANEAAAVTARVLDLADLAAGDPPRAQVVLAADVFYQREFAAVALRFLRRAAESGAGVLVADPGRAFLPTSNLTPLTSYRVPVLSVLEDTAAKNVFVYRVSLRATGLSTAAAAGRGRRAAPGTAPRRPPRQAGSSHKRSGPCRSTRTRARSGSTRR